jgi:hemoglobin-like flavoprotein
VVGKGASDVPAVAACLLVELTPAEGIAMDESTLKVFEDSLARCTSAPGFEDRFYEIFLASSPKVAVKFANTDFVRQKKALRASLEKMVLVAADEETGPDRYLRELAEKHSSRQLDIGAELYDYWLDSLLVTVKERDPAFGPAVEDAWESVMTIGIRYLLMHY